MSINNYNKNFNESLRTYYIYLITNKINSKNYVGQRLCPLDKIPKTDNYMGSGVRLHWAYDKYGIENFTKEIIAICHSKTIVDILEKEYIRQYREIGKAEYNVADGGLNLDSTSEIWKENQRRVVNSEKWRAAHRKAIESEEYHEKLRIAQRKRWSDPETRAECSRKSKERWSDPEVKRKHSERAKGRVFTPETRKKIGDRNREIMLSKHLHWYTNGVEDVIVKECPLGYWKGKSKTIKGRKKKPMSEEQKQYFREKFTGLVWWNNGVEQIKSRTQPEGYVRGRLPRVSEYSWYTNGKDNIMSKSCPEGYHLGRYMPKRTMKMHWYTNDVINTKAPTCPKGFHPGMIHKPFSEEHKRKLSEAHKHHK